MMPVFVLWLLLCVCSVSVDGLEKQASVGGTAELPCNFTMSMDTMKIFIMYIQKSGTNQDEVVYERYYGEENSKNQHEKYKNRTYMDLSSFTVHLSNIKIIDEGLYECSILQKKENGLDRIHMSSFNLRVYAHYSAPQISMTPDATTRYGDKVNLTCVTGEGYPEAVIQWSVKSGNVTLEVVPKEPAVLRDNMTGLYNISSIALVNVTEDAVITCSVENPELNIIKTSVNYYLNMTQETSPGNGTILCVAVIVLIILLLLLLVFLILKKRCSKGSYYFHRRRENEYVATAMPKTEHRRREEDTDEELNTRDESTELRMPQDSIV